MPSTRDFRDTVKARADADPAFRAGLYREAVQEMLDGQFGSARLLLRDFINATIGFPALAALMGVGAKSLMRMFSPAGNPTADNLLTVLHVLKDECRLSLTVAAKPLRRQRAMPERRSFEAA